MYAGPGVGCFTQIKSMPDNNKIFRLLNNRILIYLLLSLILFVPLFVYRQAGPLDFWWWMSLNLVLLISSALITDPSYVKLIGNDFREKAGKKILIGIVSAVILYLVFLAGNYLVRFIISFASENINDVYGFKGSATDVRIALLMLIVIGPGEELFWRAYLQEKLSLRFGKLNGFLLATFLYAVVHIATGNIVLIMAAMICGIFWGFLYMKYKSVIINMLSHTLWDVTVFIMLPFV